MQHTISRRRGANRLLPSAWLALCGLLVLSPALHAQVHGAGPAGGVVRAVALDPVNEDVVYVGTEFAGIFKSSNGGQSWAAANIGLTSTLVQALAVDPTNSANVYAGTSGGVYKSTNSGGAWVPSNAGLTALGVNALVIGPTAPSTVYAATVSGVFKSTNGGSSWVASGLASLFVRTLVIDPTSPSTLYAGTNTGVFKSTNGGLIWTLSSSGVTNLSISYLSVDPNNPSILYAAANGGNFKSTDGAASWSELNLLNGAIRTIVVDPTNSARLYAGFFAGLFVSSDGGDSWTLPSPGLTQSVESFAIGRNTGTLYAGVRNTGIFKSSNRGITWTAVTTGLAALNITSLATTGATPGGLLAGTSGGGIFRQAGSGTKWLTSNTGLLNQDIRVVVVAPTNPNMLYAVGGFALLNAGVYRSMDGGASWTRAVTGLTDTSNVWCLAVDPFAATTVYAGSSAGVFKSTNGGSSWTSSNAGLTSLDIRSIVVDPANPLNVYAATFSGSTFKSSNGGASWVLNHASFGGGMAKLAIDPQMPSTIYVVTFGGLFKSTDGGGSWTQPSTALNSVGPNYLAIDPQNSLLLYAGTASGVYRSINGGQSWIAAGSSLALKGTLSLVVDPENGANVYAGTWGGVYRSTDHGTTWAPTAITDPISPTISWTTPSPIVYGTPLSGNQLNATADVPGTFTYTPTAGVVLAAGTHTLSVSFTPFDAVNYTSTATAITVTVNPAAPTATVGGEAVYDGHPHSALASATGVRGEIVGGSFGLTYLPGGLSTPVNAGTYGVVASFTSNDPNYTNVTVSGVVTILSATPVMAAIGGTFTYDGSSHSVATSATGVEGALVAGTFSVSYAPGGTSVPINAGSYAAIATFLSADPNYTNTNQTVSLTITQATPALTVTGGIFGYNGLPHPATAIATGLGGAQLAGAVAIAYAPGATQAPIAVGDYAVAATFTSSDPNYGKANAFGSIAVIPLSPLASMTVATDRPVYPRAQPVAISGRVKAIDGSGIANIPVAVQLSLNGSLRTFGPYTDAQGAYHVLFQPAATDSGPFTVSASATASGLTQTASATFRILGFLISPGSVNQDLAMGTDATIPLTLQNVGDASLNNLTYSITSTPAGAVTANVSQSATTLPPGASTVVPVLLSAALGEAPASPVTVQVQITAKDALTGATDQATSTLIIDLRPAISTAVLAPANLSVGINPGQRITRRFLVSNTGFVPMTNATVSLLQNSSALSWVSLGNASLGDIPPGELRDFQVTISPPAGTPLGDYAVPFMVTGGSSVLQSVVNIAVTQATLGTAAFVVSDDTGGKVNGATVSLYNTAAGTLFQAVTGEDGQAAVTGVPAGDYSYAVSAPSHDPTTGTASITANAITTVPVLLSYDVVSLSFTVTPTTILDQYNVTLNVTYATKLPKPALQVLPESIEFSFFPGDAPDGRLACSLEIANTHPTATVRNLLIDASQLDLAQPNGKRLHVFFADGASVYQAGSLAGKAHTTVGCYATIDGGDLDTHNAGNIFVQANYDYSLDGQVLEGTTVTKVRIDYTRPSELAFTPIEFVYDLRNDPDHPVLKYNAGSYVYRVKSNRAVSIDFFKPAASPFAGRNLVAFTALQPAATALELINTNPPFWKTDFTKQRLEGSGDTSTFDISALDPPGAGGGTLEQALNAQIARNSDQTLRLPTYLGFEGQWADSADPRGFLIPVSITVVSSDKVIKIGPARGEPGPDLCERFDDPNPLCKGFPEFPVFSKDGTILLAIDQTVRLERQAFNATLGIAAQATLTSAVTTLRIRDANGDDAANKFFLLVTSDPLGATRGGTLSGQTGVSWQLVPKADAGGIAAAGARYTVQAMFNYLLEGTPKSLTTSAVTITVLPSPKLTVAYTAPFVIMVGKDAKIRVTVKNLGAGVARNLVIQSAQPRIVASIPDDPGDDLLNPKLGPVVDFTLTGASNTADGTGFQSENLSINFGDVAPGATVSGYWTLRASRSGFFIDISAAFTHQDYQGIQLDPLVLPPTTSLIPAIGGTVTTDSVQGIPGLTVRLSHGGTAVATDTTDFSGVYYIPDLAAGAYLEEVVDLSGAVLQTKTISVLADQGTNFINFTIDNYNSTLAIVLIESLPPGITFTADGATYATPHSFTWDVGSTHTVSAPEFVPAESGHAADSFSFAGWENAETVRSRTISVGALGAAYTMTLKRTEEYLRYTRTQITTDPADSEVDHKWPSTNRTGDLVWSQKDEAGYWQVYIQGPDANRFCTPNANGRCRVTSEPKNHERPVISDIGSMAWFQDNTGGGLGYAVMRLDANSSTPLVVEFSNRNVNTQLNCSHIAAWLVILEVGCSTNFQEHAAGKTFGIATDGRLISYYTFYDQGYATDRPFTMNVTDKLPEGPGPAANFIGYGSPDINSIGHLVYATDFVKGVTSKTHHVWLATTTQPFDQTLIDEGDSPHISEEGEIAFVQGGIDITHWTGADPDHWVARGLWTDIVGGNQNATIIYECVVNGYSQICRATPSSTGTIEVKTNLTAATFTIDRIDEGLMIAGGGRSSRQDNVPSGTYKIIYGAVEGYKSPSSATAVLVAGATIEFNGTYQGGKIDVATNVQEAKFKVVSVLADFDGSGLSLQQPNAPAADYTATFSPVVGYSTPRTDTRTLLVGGTIAFSGTYSPYRVALVIDRPVILPVNRLSAPYREPPYITTATVSVTDRDGAPVQFVTVNFNAVPAVLAAAGNLASTGHDHASIDPSPLHNLATAPGGFFVDLETGESFLNPTCTTRLDGTCQLAYSSRLSGRFTITASVDAAGLVFATKDIDVEVAPLKQLPPGTNGSGYTLTGQWNGGDNGVHSEHSDNHFIEQVMYDKLLQLIKSYHSKGGGTLGINDISLMRGGLFDINNDWHTPHALHFFGQSVDIDHKDVEGNDVNEQLLEDIASPLGLHKINEGKTSIHLELVPKRVP